MSSPAAPLALRCGDAVARLDPRGAELRRWAVGDTELLWSGDPRWWARCSPLLFPLVGRLRDDTATFGSLTTRMTVHGFAADADFEVVEHGPQQALLRLRSDARTRSAYPFDFELDVQVRLDPSSVATTLSLRNTGTQPMPWSMGLHPGLRWPWHGTHAQGFSIVFADDERPQVPVITPQGLFTDGLRPLPLQGRRLPLTAQLLAREALCLLGARSRSLAFEAPDGSAIVFEAEGFDHWALWSPPGAPLLSIESWTGHGDPVDGPREFAQRPWTRHLAPGDHAVLRHRMRWQPAGTRP